MGIQSGVISRAMGLWRRRFGIPLLSIPFCLAFHGFRVRFRVGFRIRVRVGFRVKVGVGEVGFTNTVDIKKIIW